MQKKVRSRARRRHTARPRPRGTTGKEEGAHEWDGKSFYEILGVDKHASVDAIRAAYKKKCLVYHPDRNQGASDRAAINEKFTRVGRAFEVLVDPLQRDVYDHEGEAGLAQLKEDVRAWGAIVAEHKWAKRKAEYTSTGEGTGVATHGTLMETVIALHIDASDYLVDWVPLAVPWRHRHLRTTRVMAVHRAEMELGPNDNLTLGARAMWLNPITPWTSPPLTPDLPPVTMTARAGWRHDWGGFITEADMTKTFSTEHSSDPAEYSITVQGKPWSEGVVQAQVHGGAWGVRSMVSGGHVIANNVVGTAGVSVGPIDVAGHGRNFSHVGVEHRGVNMTNKASLRIQPQLVQLPFIKWGDQLIPDISFSFVLDPTYEFEYAVSKHLQLTGSVSLTRGITLSVASDLDEETGTEVAVHVAGGTMAVEPTLTNNGITYQLNALLACLPPRDEMAALHPLLDNMLFRLPVLASMAMAIPLIGLGVLQFAVIEPRRRHLKRKERDELRAKSMESVAAAKEKTAVVQKEMADEAKAIRTEEMRKRGLIIVSARYGRVDEDGYWCDVTVPLQFYVDDSTVHLPEESKRSLEGFYDPAVYEEKELYVEYLFHGRTHEARFGDHDEVLIPRRHHLVKHK